MSATGFELMKFAEGKTVKHFTPLSDGFILIFTNGESIGAELVQTGNDEATMKYSMSGRVTSFNGQQIQKTEDGKNV